MLCLVYVQPIISKARTDLLKSHFLPTLEKLKKKTVKVVCEEELLKADSKGDTQEAELLILDEFAVLCRDLYAFYPMLIRYVDNNRLAGCRGARGIVSGRRLTDPRPPLVPLQVQVAERTRRRFQRALQNGRGDFHPLVQVPCKFSSMGGWGGGRLTP